MGHDVDTVSYDLRAWSADARAALDRSIREHGLAPDWRSHVLVMRVGERVAVDRIIGLLNGTVIDDAPGAPRRESGSSPPAAWYPDPAGEATWRWWNGERWTVHVAEPPTRVTRPWFPPAGDRAFAMRGGGIALVGFVVGELLSLGVVLLAIALGASSRSVLTFVLGAAGLWTGLLGSCLVAVRRHGNGSLSALGLVRLRWSDLGVGMLASIVARVGAVIIAVILVLILPDDSFGEGTSIVDADRVSVIGMLVVGAIVVLGAAFFEELFFRGLVQGVLTGRLGSRTAIPVQGIAFAVVHYQIGMTAAQAMITFASIGFTGLLLGALRWRYERLGPGMVMHAAFNLVAVVLTFTLV